jgi:hypothetical protein
MRMFIGQWLRGFQPGHIWGITSNNQYINTVSTSSLSTLNFSSYSTILPSIQLLTQVSFISHFDLLVILSLPNSSTISGGMNSRSNPLVALSDSIMDETIEELFGMHSAYDSYIVREDDVIPPDMTLNTVFPSTSLSSSQDNLSGLLGDPDHNMAKMGKTYQPNANRDSLEEWYLWPNDQTIGTEQDSLVTSGPNAHTSLWLPFSNDNEMDSVIPIQSKPLIRGSSYQKDSVSMQQHLSQSPSLSPTYFKQTARDYSIGEVWSFDSFEYEGTQALDTEYGTGPRIIQENRLQSTQCQCNGMSILMPAGSLATLKDAMFQHSYSCQLGQGGREGNSRRIASDNGCANPWAHIAPTQEHNHEGSWEGISNEELAPFSAPEDLLSKGLEFKITPTKTGIIGADARVLPTKVSTSLLAIRKRPQEISLSYQDTSNMLSAVPEPKRRRFTSSIIIKGMDSNAFTTSSSQFRRLLPGTTCHDDEKATDDQSSLVQDSVETKYTGKKSCSFCRYRATGCENVPFHLLYY